MNDSELWGAISLVILAVFFAGPLVKLLLWAFVRLMPHRWKWPQELVNEVEYPFTWMVRIAFLWGALAVIDLNLHPLPVWVFGVPLIAVTLRIFNVVANVVVRRGMKNRSKEDIARRRRLVEATKGVRNLLVFLLGYAIYPGNLSIFPPNTILLPLIAVVLLLSLTVTSLANDMMASILVFGVNFDVGPRLSVGQDAEGTMLYLSRGNIKLRRMDGAIDYVPAGQLLFFPLRVYSYSYRNSVLIALSPKVKIKDIRLLLRSLSLMLQDFVVRRDPLTIKKEKASSVLMQSMATATSQERFMRRKSSVKSVAAEPTPTDLMTPHDVPLPEEVPALLSLKNRKDVLASTYVYYCGGHTIRLVWESTHPDDLMHLQEASKVTAEIHRILETANVHQRAAISVERIPVKTPPATPTSLRLDRSASV